MKQQKELPPGAHSITQNTSGLALNQSIQQLPISKQRQNIQHLQNIQITRIKNSDLLRPFAPSNRSAELLPIKISPPLIPNKLGANPFIKTPQIFHR